MLRIYDSLSPASRHLSPPLIFILTRLGWPYVYVQSMLT